MLPPSLYIFRHVSMSCLSLFYCAWENVLGLIEQTITGFTNHVKYMHVRICVMLTEITYGELTGGRVWYDEHCMVK